MRQRTAKPTVVSVSAVAFSSASHCRDRRNLIASSAGIGWTSILLERHRLRGGGVESESRRTSDVQMFVLARGQMQLSARRGVQWQHWAYEVGTAGVLEGRVGERLRLEPRRPDQEVEIAQLFVPELLFEEVADEYRRAGQEIDARPRSALGFRDPTVADAMSALVRAMANGVPNLYAEAFAYALATHLLSEKAPWRRSGSLEPDLRSEGRIADPRLARVLEYMSVHFAEPLDLARLAREAGVSKFHFARLFRDRTSTTPHRHLVDLRLAAAGRMLTGTDRSIGEVAAACGYENAAHFGAAFRRRYGTSPGDFRRRRRA